MPASTCPSTKQISHYLVGKLDQRDIDEVASHVAACSSCQAHIEQLDARTADPLIDELRSRQPPDDPFDDESSYSDALNGIKAIGRQPTLDLSKKSRRDDEPLLEELRDYRILEKIGQGGMGAVYKALHTRLDKVVAIKVLPADRMRDEHAVERFDREMKAVGRLEHPNIVQARDAGETDGRHYLVMEYVAGIDLSSLVARNGPLPIAEACALVRQAAEGLQFVHKNGMVHRDIKPSNLMVTHEAQVKILDLGLALLHEQPADLKQHSSQEPVAENGQLTSVGQVMGTLDYMAPEQCDDSHQVDIRADIYSLGATLYKLLVGRGPFEADRLDTPIKKMMALTGDPIPAIKKQRPDLPQALAQIVTRMLARDPARRFATPADVVTALTPWAESHDLNGWLATALDQPLDTIKTENLMSVDEADTNRQQAATDRGNVFDPYHKWLSIPPEEQPPHHYRLLGLKLFEADPEVIEMAADRQMAHVRTFQSGRHSSASQNVLNQISAAKVTLINAAKRAAYDAKLKVQLAARKPKRAAAKPDPKTAIKTPATAEPPSATALSFAASQPSAPQKPVVVASDNADAAPFFTQPMVWAATALVAVVLVGVIAFVATHGNDPFVAESPVTTLPEDQDRGIDIAAPTIANAPEAHDDNPAPGSIFRDTADQTAASPRTVEPPRGSTSQSGPREVTRQPPTDETSSGNLFADNSSVSVPSTSRPGAPSSGVIGPDQSVDLFSVINPARDATSGEWSLANGRLSVEQPQGQAQLLVPVELDGGYELTIDAEKPAGESLHVGLPLRDSYVSLVIDSNQAGAKGRGGSGLSNLRGQPFADNSSHNSFRRFDDKQRHTIQIVVTFEFATASITVNFDGRNRMIYQKLPRQSFSADPAFAPANPKSPFLGVRNATFVFHKVELKMLDGEAKLLQRGNTSLRGDEVATTTDTAPQTTADASVGDGPPDDAPAESTPRLTVPDRDELAQAAQRVTAIFGAQIDAADTPVDKVNVARELIATAAKSSNDPVVQFSLLAKARELGVAAADSEVINEVAAALDGRFEIDAIVVCGGALIEAGKQRLPEAVGKKLALAMLELSDKAAAVDRFDISDSICDAAHKTALATKDGEFIRQVKQRTDYARDVERMFTAARQARELLKDKPDDQDAHLRVAKYVCYIKRDWQSGLPHLADGSDAALAKLAKQDVAAAESPDDQIKVADAWWAAAEEERDEFANPAQLARAADWYRRALQHATGLPQIQAERRLAEYAKLAEGDVASIKPERSDAPAGPIAFVPVGKIPTADDSQFCVVYSRDGKLIAAGMRDYSMVWNTETGKLVGKYNVPNIPSGRQAGVVAVAFSPDGKTLATSGYGPNIVLFDVASVKMRGELKSAGEWITGLDFSPDGSVLASAAREQAIRLWDGATGNQRKEFRGYYAGTWCVAFSPNGQLLASVGSDGFLTVHNMKDGQRIGHPRISHVKTNSVAWSPAGTLLATGSESMDVDVFNAQTFEKVAQLKGHAAAVSAVAFAPTTAPAPMLVSADKQSYIRVWNPATAKEVLLFKAPSGSVSGIAFSPDGKHLATCGSGESITIWEIRVQRSRRR